MPQKATVHQKQNMIRPESIVYNQLRNQYIYEQNGDIFFADIKSGITKHITQTIEFESNPQFGFLDKKIIYIRASNLFGLESATH